MRILITAVVFASSVSLASAQQAPPAAPSQQRPTTPPPVSAPSIPARPGGQPQGQAPPAAPSQVRPAQAPPTQPPPAQAQGARPSNLPPSGPAPQAYVWQNLKIDVKISDSQTSDVSTSKTVSLYCADNRKGQVRSNSGEGLINVDAQPSIRPDGKIHLMLTVEYRPSNVVAFSESLDVMVVDGRPLVLSQSADARSDRKVTVEVTATIVK